MTELPPSPTDESPKWGSTTKTVIGLAIIAIFAGLLFYFRNIIAPLLLAFILTFLLHPMAAWISKTLKIGWRMSVNLIFLFLVLLLIATVTASGFAIVQQAQSLMVFIDKFIQTLPEFVSNLSRQNFYVGPLRIDFSELDLLSLTNQLLNAVQPVIGQAGSLLGKFATSAATTVAWTMFLLVISYFVLAEGGQLRENLMHIEIPGYNADIQTLFHKLFFIWDAFLRGQLIISILTIFSYYVMLSLLGTRLALVIALMAGLARFVPYVGPAVTWTLTAIVAFFQAGNYFGLQPWAYTLLVVGACMVLDFIFDNMVVPRLLGGTLGIHPAGILLSAIILARLIGVIGVVFAAPVLATLTLLGGYIFRKMFDLPPWPPPTGEPPPAPEPVWVRLSQLLHKVRSAFQKS